MAVNDGESDCTMFTLGGDAESDVTLDGVSDQELGEECKIVSDEESTTDVTRIRLTSAALQALNDLGTESTTAQSVSQCPAQTLQLLFR